MSLSEPVLAQLFSTRYFAFSPFSKIALWNIIIVILLFFFFKFAFRYSIVSGNERMTFMMEPDTGVLRLSNKRRQGMKLSYHLNVSVSDGVFTNTAQVRQLLSSYIFALSTDLLFNNLFGVHRQEAGWPLATPSLQICYAHSQLSSTTAVLCSWGLMCIRVISDLQWGWAASWKEIFTSVSQW